jgi:hypothetical protein
MSGRLDRHVAALLAMTVGLFEPVVFSTALSVRVFGCSAGVAARVVWGGRVDAVGLDRMTAR